MKLSALFILGASLLSASASSVGKGTFAEEERLLESFERGLKGGKDSKDSGKGGTQECETVDGECNICCGSDGSKLKPTSLTFEYNPNGMVSQYQPEDKASCRDAAFPATATIGTDASSQVFEVEAGTKFTVNGISSAELAFNFQGFSGLDCFVHASCSVPLVPGDQIGPFIVVGDNTGCDGTGSTSPPDECLCEICTPDNKNRPLSLTLQYLSEGKNSMFQDEQRATCREGTYPEATELRIVNKDGVQQTFSVTSGDVFTIDGAFDAETDFYFTTGSVTECFIHTSCSQALVAGDQIGPFRVLQGGDCECPPAGGECVEVDVTTDVCVGDPFNVNFDFDDALPDDWIGIYPCDATVYLHAQVYQYNCGSNTCLNDTPALNTGALTFDSLPVYNVGGPHSWPVPEGCWRAVYLRNDGPSVPPYIQVCESEIFNVVDCP